MSKIKLNYKYSWNQSRSPYHLNFRQHMLTSKDSSKQFVTWNSVQGKNGLITTSYSVQKGLWHIENKKKKCKKSLVKLEWMNKLVKKRTKMNYAKNSWVLLVSRNSPTFLPRKRSRKEYSKFRHKSSKKHKKHSASNSKRNRMKLWMPSGRRRC